MNSAPLVDQYNSEVKVRVQHLVFSSLLRQQMYIYLSIHNLFTKHIHQHYIFKGPSFYFTIINFLR
jgi:hypothetical protein